MRRDNLLSPQLNLNNYFRSSIVTIVYNITRNIRLYVKTTVKNTHITLSTPNTYDEINIMGLTQQERTISNHYLSNTPRQYPIFTPKNTVKPFDNRYLETSCNSNLCTSPEDNHSTLSCTNLSLHPSSVRKRSSFNDKIVLITLIIPNTHSLHLRRQCLPFYHVLI